AAGRGIRGGTPSPRAPARTPRTGRRTPPPCPAASPACVAVRSPSDLPNPAPEVIPAYPEAGPEGKPALENGASSGDNNLMTVSPSDAAPTHAPALRSLPPGPRGSWLFGNLGDFRRDMLGFYTRCAALGDVVPYRLGFHRMCLVNHPDLVEQV